MTAEDIAIVGVGCRFPGADNVEEFWRVLLNGEDLVKEIPINRWNNDAFFDEDQTVHGKTYVRKAGLLNNHDIWDNRLFGISDVEARQIDPQQRYVLECVHMALEDGGITRKHIRGLNTGVIIGCMNNDYKAISNSSKADIGSYNATSTSASVISARVSYVYNLQGTCLTLDTACSSALVAIHLASQAIQTGDCDMMICGGVSSILTPDTLVTLCKARMLSATGKCQSFCETADGYARGEGCGIVILKSLKSALEDGNKIWATIKTGSNQDGSIARPMTAPSADQQLKLLREVYDRHKFDPAAIQYIEAHGTGTPRGDPTEIHALGQFFHSFRQTTNPLLVGSVKSNIGHTESAAGVAGLIKVLLMMRYGKYVPSLHVTDDRSNINKKLKLTEYGLDIITSLQDWKLNNKGTRHACLNSFGFGGSNTHAIISQANTSATAHDKTQRSGTMCFCISGLDQKTLELNLIDFQRYLLNSDDDFLYGISKTSLVHRGIYPFRTLLYGNHVSDLQQECSDRIAQVQHIMPHKYHNIVFVYCGEGTTWTGMGQTLMRENDVFIQKIKDIDEYLEPHVGWKIGTKLASNSIYDNPECNIIAIFSIQVALTEVWRNLGVRPNKIVGQSIGEIAASYAANLLSLEEAVAVVYHIARTLSREDEGSMVVIGNIRIDVIERMCKEHGFKAKIVVYNSPICCTVSGNEDIIKLMLDDLRKSPDSDKVFIRKLNVNRSYHLQLLQTSVHEITSRIDVALSQNLTKDTMKRPNVIPMVSTVTNGIVSTSQIRSGSYWVNNILQPVQFMQGINTAYDNSKYNIFLELGPQPVLKAHVPHIVKYDTKTRTLPSIKVNNEYLCFYSSIRQMFELGVNVLLEKLVVDSVPSKMAGIPRYSFKRTCTLYMPKTTEDYLSGSFVTDERSHMYVDKINETDFRLCIDPVSTPFVYDHFISNKIIVPGATYVEAGFHIGTLRIKKPANQLSVSFSFLKTCTPNVEKQTRLSIQVDKKKSNIIKFSILHESKVLARGSVKSNGIYKTKNLDIENLQSLCPTYKSKTECYACLADLNFRYGESLSLIKDAWLSVTSERCLTKIRLPENIYVEGTEKTYFHPAVIDSVFQIFGILEKESIGEKQFVIPKGVKAVRLHRHIEMSMFAYAEKVAETSTSTHYNAVLLTNEGRVIAEIDDFYTTIISNEEPSGEQPISYEIEWFESNVFQYKELSQKNTLLLYSNRPDGSLFKKLGKRARTIVLKDVHNLCLEKYILDENVAFVYHVGKNEEETTLYNGNEELDSIVKRFLELKDLIAALERLESKQSLSILTENTQICMGRNIINTTGSELWGMIRTAFHESALKNFKLIDIDPENIDIAVLSQLILSKSGNNYEYAIVGTNVYSPRLVATKRKKVPHRSLQVDQYKDLAIYATELSNTGYQSYLSFAEIEEPPPQSQRIRLESFTLHETAYYPSISPTSMNSKILNGKVGGQMLALEGVGSAENGQMFLFLFPVDARTYVYVPPEFLIISTNNDSYISGMLILVHSLVQIAAEVNEYSKLAVIRNTEECDTGQQIFDNLVKQKHCTVSFCTIKKLRKYEDLVQAETLILTQRFSLKQLLLCLRHFRGVEEIISINSFVPKDLPTIMSQLFPKIKLNLLNAEEMFRMDKIRKSIPLIRKELLNCESHGKVIRKTFILTLPMKTIDIRKQIVNQDLKLFCDESTLFRHDSCYIVTGGATGLGWELLKLMVEKGAGMVVNFSRRKPSNIVQEHMDSLADKFSCKIISLQVDVSDIDSVESGFKEIQTFYFDFSVKGIFHGAGVTSDSILENLQEENISKVIRPKILGALNLHRASLKFPLDYFVLHSSIVSVIGNPGQSNYAAANSFLDTFAHYRRSLSLPAQSINWGPLSVGLAVETDAMKSILEKKGFRSIGTEIIKDIFIEALMNDSTNSVYSDINWEKMLSIPTFQRQSIKFSNFLNQGKVKHSNERLQNVDIDRLKYLGKDERSRKVKFILKEIICRVLVIRIDTFDDNRSLTDIGLDSMASMSLSNGIHDAFGCRIPVVTLLSDSSSVTSLAEVIITSFISKDITHSENKFKSIIQDYKFNDPMFDSDTSNVFKSDTISFMQADLLTRCKKGGSNPFDLRVIDMEITGVECSMDEWKEILVLVIKVHPELRKRFMLSKDNVINAEIVSESEVMPEIIEVDEHDLRNPTEKDVRKTLSLDVFDSLPVSFIIACTKNGALIRIIFHAVVFDMRSLSIVFKTIEWAGQVVVNKSNEPYKHPLINVQNVIRKAIMPRMEELELYWKQNLNIDINPITLAATLSEINEAFCCIRNTDISPEKVTAIKVYIARLGISIYEFFMSMYQLFLHVGSNLRIIAVGTAADMRFHVPELNHMVTRCTNYIPVIAYIDEELSLNEFVKRNSKQISEATKYGAFPSSLILKFIKSDDARKNIFRHFMSMNDMKDISKLMNESTQVSVKIKKIWHTTPTRETFIYVRYDLQNNLIQLETGYNTEICGAYGEQFANILIDLIDLALNNDYKSISEIRKLIIKRRKLDEWCQPMRPSHFEEYTDFPTTQGSAAIQNTEIIPMTSTPGGSSLQNQDKQDDITEACIDNIDQYDDPLNEEAVVNPKHLRILLSGQFLKQTAHGWDHKVDITLLTSPDGKAASLQWGKERKLRKSYNRVMHLSDFKSIALRRINGISSITIVSKTRNLILKSVNKFQADEWFERIQGLLQPNGNDELTNL